MTVTTLSNKELADRLDKFKGMMSRIPRGYYAVKRDDREGVIDFMRVSYPTTGDFKGTMKVQTQHGDKLKVRVVIRLTPGGVSTYTRDTLVEDARIAEVLFTLLPTIVEAGILYAQKKGKCCRCGKSLTLERSRYYGIGPECEDGSPEVIEYVNMSRGVYYEGKTQRDEEDILLGP